MKSGEGWRAMKLAMPKEDVTLQRMLRAVLPVFRVRDRKAAEPRQLEDIRWYLLHEDRRSSSRTASGTCRSTASAGPCCRTIAPRFTRRDRRSAGPTSPKTATGMRPSTITITCSASRSRSWHTAGSIWPSRRAQGGGQGPRQGEISGKQAKAKSAGKANKTESARKVSKSKPARGKSHARTRFRWWARSRRRWFFSYEVSST